MSKTKSLLKFLPAALWYGLIWRMSAQTATVSSQSSGSLMGSLFSAVIADYRDAAALTQQAVQELVSFYIRKGAHMFLFFILAILLWFGFSGLIQKRPLRALCTALACAVLAASDEFHQTFVPGRSGEIRDVLVDLSGSLIALLLFALPIIGLWLCRNLKRPERLWAMGAGAGAILLVYVGLLTGLAPIFVPWVGNSPFLAEFPAEERSALVASAAPILRQLLYLLSCAVTGFLSVFLAVLSGDHRATLTAFATALCLSLIAGLIWTLPVLAGFVLCLIGSGAALFLHKCFPLLSQ